jgi:hypothetical protein
MDVKEALPWGNPVRRKGMSPESRRCWEAVLGRALKGIEERDD